MFKDDMLENQINQQLLSFRIEIVLIDSLNFSWDVICRLHLNRKFVNNALYLKINIS